MPLQPFNSVGGFSVGTGNALVIDSSGGFSGATATFRTVTASNIVNSVNGITGNVGLPLATSSITGVASFNTNDFTVSTGAVSLTSSVVKTNTTNTFTSLQTFNAGITTQSAFVSQGLTVGGRAAFNSGITSANLFVGAGVTLNSSMYVGGNSTLGGTTANTITLPSGQVVKTYLSTRTSTSEFVLASELLSGYSSADIVIQAEYYIDGGGGTNALQSTRILLVANPVGLAVKHVQYGDVFVGATCASYDVDTDGANIWRLKATPKVATGLSPCDFRAYAILSPNIGGAGV